jgi:F-type H+-transporting ATPase subunit a
MSQNNAEHTTGTVASPHIPKVSGEDSWILGLSNTNITTIIFFFLILVMSLFANKALKSKKKSKIRTFFLTFVKFMDTEIRKSFWTSDKDKKIARTYFPLIVWIFLIILLWNLFGLIIDWLWMSINWNILHYLRPVHSDLNTTVALAGLVIISFLYLWVKTHWWFKYAKWYLFNWKWKSIWDKCINVFVGWLHFIGLWSTLASLSLRLFGNIFAWVILIWVIAYLWVLMSANLFEVGRFLSVPFWFFELFVALIQALVFTWLAISYLAQAKEEH